MSPRLEWVIATDRREDIPAHTILVPEGTPIEAVYIVTDGAFAVSVAGKGAGRLLSGSEPGSFHRTARVFLLQAPGFLKEIPDKLGIRMR